MLPKTWIYQFSVKMAQVYESFNHKLVLAGNVSICARSSASLFGKGTFTTIAINETKPVLWEKHWRRLTANAAKVGIDISEFSEDLTLNTLYEIIKKNNLAKGRARITLFDESPSKIWSFDTGRKSSLLITTADNREIADNFRLTVSPHRVNTTSPLTGIKSCNYLEHLMAFEEAKARGFEEAIRLNERGEVASACMANVFWLKSGKLHTPSLKTGCLAGTTREFILESLDCVEIEATIDDLNSADDIFLTSAGIGVVQVAEFDGKAMQRKQHKILEIVPKPI
jgi:branched-subunit amino acid aminotransferase/4-amino-4-deoxychorismate lyase